MSAGSAISERAGARVLLVDEDIEELASLAASLRQRGVQVALANGVGMACERAKTARVDVVIAASELAEAREDGLSLFDALAIELGQLPPVLLLVREGPGPLQGESMLRGDVEALLARIAVLAAAPGALRGRESGPPSAVYAGSLSKVSLGDVIETLWVDRKTGALGVTTPAGAGDVRLVNGAVVDAVYLRFEGMKALVRMFGEPEGRFVFTPDTPVVLGRMTVATAHLLAEIASQAAESRRLRERLGDLASKALLATDAGDPDAVSGSRASRPAPDASSSPRAQRPSGELSPLARMTLTKLRAPATIDQILDELPEPDAQVLAAIVELDAAGRLKRLPYEMQRVPLVGMEQLHLIRALVSRASAPGYAGAARFVFAGTPSRLAIFAHAALSLADALPSLEPPPAIPIPYTIATVRLGDDVEIEITALPLVPAYAPLWPLALAGSAIVVRLDDAAGSALSEACAAAELPVLDAQVLVGALEEGSVAQVASLVRAAIEATQGA